MSISILNDPNGLKEFKNACNEIAKVSNTTPPFRNGEEECRVYVRTGVCSYGPTCKHHHPLRTCWNVDKLLQLVNNEYQNEQQLSNLKDFIAYIKRFVVILPGISKSISNHLLILLNNCLLITQELIDIQSTLISLSENHYIFHLNIINELTPLLIYTISNLFKNDSIEVNELLDKLKINCKTWKDNESELNINIKNLSSSNQGDFVIGLNQSIIDHCESNDIVDTIETRECIRQELLDYINKIWIDKEVGVQLIMFGSSSSNIGSPSSDIDLSLNFDSIPSPNQFGKENKVSPIADDVLPSLILEDIVYYMKLQDLQDDHTTAPSLFTIKELVNARVPVLKLTHKETNIDVDICIGNTLAIENTALLRNYSLYDDRARLLILAVKYWAKMRGCNDATNSTLTSYAWVLKVIFFLQYDCKPPVLPNLQSTSNEKFEKLNSNSVEELFIQFFLYYGTASINSFDPYIHVCSIKNAHPVLKKSAKLLPQYEHYIQDLSLLPNDENSNDVSDKATTSWKISIEDPLEDHDLGRVIHSIEGQIHLTSELRRVIGLIQKHLMNKDKNTNIWDEICMKNDLIPSILFKCRYCNLTGHSSKDCSLNVCNCCGKAGHYIKDCPRFICHCCGESGHKARDCPNKATRYQRDNNNRFNKNRNQNRINNNERINYSRTINANSNIKSIHNPICSEPNKINSAKSSDSSITRHSNLENGLSAQRRPFNISNERNNINQRKPKVNYTNVSSTKDMNVQEGNQSKVSILQRVAPRPATVPSPVNLPNSTQPNRNNSTQPNRNNSAQPNRNNSTQPNRNNSRVVTVIPPTPPL
jgi:hypothetical protein